MKSTQWKPPPPLLQGQCQCYSYVSGDKTTRLLLLLMQHHCQCCDASPKDATATASPMRLARYRQTMMNQAEKEAKIVN